MAKSLFEQLGGTYRKESDYLIPCLTVSVEDERVVAAISFSPYMIKTIDLST